MGKKVDIHIHTPASADYKGIKDDKEYIAILEKCYEDGIETIAITDHNTLCGYKNLLNIKKNLEVTLSTVSITNAPQDYVNSLKHQYSLFKKVHIIPGVELSVYPKLHLLVLFRESIDLEKIDNFLINQCKLGEKFDKGVTDHLIQKTPTELLDELTKEFKHDFLVILPHVDSTNGAWNELQGQSRINLFKHQTIFCCQILNLETKKAINAALKNREYSGTRQITFIQASDFHGAEGSRPGAQHTIFETNDLINFETLKRLIRTQTPSLSSEKIDAQYQNFIEDKIIIEIELINHISIDSDEFLDEICKKFCAFLNTENCIFQVNLYNTKEDYSTAVNELMELLRKQIYTKLDPTNTTPCIVWDFSFSSTKKRIVITVKNRKKLYQYNGHVYIQAKNRIRYANSSEIESIVTRNSYNLFYKRKENFLANRIHEISIASRSFYSQSLKYKIKDKLSILDFGKVCSRPIFHNLDEEITNLAKAHGNGLIKGNCYIIIEQDIFGGRLKKQKSYLRFTCPQYFYKGELSDHQNSHQTQENSIIITSNGGVYKVNSQLHLFTSVPSIEFSLNAEDDFDYDILLGLAAYLKSNFFLWYSLMFFETDDFFGLFLGEKPFIPIPADKIILKTISSLANNIVNSEIKFLKKFDKYKDNTTETDRLITNHNNAAARQFQLIEKEIMKYFGLHSADIRHIIDTLDSLGYFTYKLDEEFDTIFNT